MNTIAKALGAIGLIAAGLIYPQKSCADAFTGVVFLTWSEADKASYINNAVVIATIVATRTNPDMATCLDEWYSTSAEVAVTRNASILSTISRNVEYHPGAIIVLALEDACGSFGTN